VHVADGRYETELQQDDERLLDQVPRVLTVQRGGQRDQGLLAPLQGSGDFRQVPAEVISQYGRAYAAVIRRHGRYAGSSPSPAAR